MKSSSCQALLPGDLNGRNFLAHPRLQYLIVKFRINYRAFYHKSFSQIKENWGLASPLLGAYIRSKLGSTISYLPASRGLGPPVNLSSS
jgi:hypothetical protein